jgi:hypothetical protein
MLLSILCFTQFDSKCHIISGCNITIITNFPDYPTAAAMLSFANEGAGDNDGSMYTHVVHLEAVISVAKSMRDLDKY